MRDNVIKVDSTRLTAWVKNHNPPVYHISSLFPKPTYFACVPSYFEYTDFIFASELTDFYTALHDTIFLKFKNKNLKDEFLKDNPDFPISKPWNEEHPLTLIIDNYEFGNFVNHDDKTQTDEVMKEIRDFFNSDVEISIPTHKGLVTDWTSEFLYTCGYFYVKFKTEDDLVLFKLSCPDNVATNL